MIVSVSVLDLELVDVRVEFQFRTWKMFLLVKVCEEDLGTVSQLFFSRKTANSGKASSPNPLKFFNGNEFNLLKPCLLAFAHFFCVLYVPTFISRVVCCTQKQLVGSMTPTPPPTAGLQRAPLDVYKKVTVIREKGDSVSYEDSQGNQQTILELGEESLAAVSFCFY